MSTLDLKAIKQRAEAVDRFCRNGSDDFRPLSQRQLFDRDVPLLLEIAEQRQADGEHLIKVLAERDRLKAELLSHRLDFLRELREKARWHVESETPGDATLNDLAAALERKWTEEAQSTFHNEPCEGCGEDNPPPRACPCGRLYCGHCECDCADWHLVVHEDHEGDYRSCRQPDCVRIKEAPDEDDDEDPL